MMEDEVIKYNPDSKKHGRCGSSYRPQKWYIPLLFKTILTFDCQMATGRTRTLGCAVNTQPLHMGMGMLRQWSHRGSPETIQ